MARRTKRNAKGSSKSSATNQKQVSTTEKVSTDNSAENKDNESDKIAEPSRDNAKNDPAWYGRDPRLVTDGANIPWNLPFGGLINLGRYGNNDDTIYSGDGGYWTIKGDATKISSPGICTLFMKPSFGSNWTAHDPVNVCANALYTYVRHLNSGRKNYDPADLFLYTATFADIYSFIMWCERTYQLAFMYSQRNYYIGREMLLSEGIDPDSIIANLANFRYWLNTAINKISSYVLPGDIYIFQRRVFLYGHYYIENPYGNIKDQLYMMTPEGFMKFGVDSNGAGKLQYQKINRGNLLHFNDFISIFNDLMSNINGDEDFGIMSGDILKAYGSNIIGISQMGEDGESIPTYDPYVLSQFKNASIVDCIRADGSKTALGFTIGDLSQDISNGLLISTECMDMSNIKGNLYLMENKTLSVDNPTPDVGDVLESTRLTVGYRGPYKENGTWTYNLLNSGTEIAVMARFRYKYAEFGSGSEAYINYDIRSNVGAAQTNAKFDTSNYVVLSNLISLGFKYAPQAFLHYTDGSGTAGSPWLTKMYLPISNLDNTTILSNENLFRIHEIALLSLYYVPGVAKLIS